MARNNISDYLNQITRLHKSSIKKENDYVMSNILTSDCVEFRMNGTKPVGKSIDGTIRGLEIDQTFDDIKDILSVFGNFGNKEYKHPVEYFINLVKYCKNNDITFECYNKHTNTRIPLSLNEIYEAIESDEVDTLYPGITDEVKDMARENHSCYYGRMQEGFSVDWVFEQENGYISRIGKGGSSVYNMVGIAYFKQKDAVVLREVIERAYAVEENGSLFWDDVVNQNLDKLRLIVEPVREGQLVEIDTVEELKRINES